MNSVKNEIKEIASSSKTLALCILLTIFVALEMVVDLTVSSGTEYMILIDALTIVVCVGLWIIYFNAKNDTELKTKGYTIVKVCYNIKLVILSICCVLVVLSCVVCAALSSKVINELQNREDEIVDFFIDNESFGGAGVSEDEFKDNFHKLITDEDAETAIVVAAVTCAVIFIIIMIFYFLYFAKMIKLLKSIRSNIQGTKGINTYHSGYLSFVFIVVAILSGLGALGSLGVGSGYACLVNVVKCAMFVVTYLIIREYKEEISRS